MNLSSDQIAKINSDPINVALSLPLGWEYADGAIPQAIVTTTLDNWFAILDPETLEYAKQQVDKYPLYYFKIIEAQKRCLAFAKATQLLQIEYEPKYNRNGGSILLWWHEDTDNGQKAAIEMAKKYQFDDPDSIQCPAAMWEILATKRIGDYLLAMVGDDRAKDDGNFYLHLYYSEQETNELFQVGLANIH